jgi:biotin carboxylase
MIKIAIIGASYLQLPLVQKANELGYETHCFAWNSNDSICKTISAFFYPISILEKELILEKCKEIQIDAILSIASDVAVPTVSYVANKMGLIANSVESALISTNKFLMRSRFKVAGLNYPNYLLIENNQDLNKVNQLNFPLIVKPIDRSGSRGVTISKDKYELIKNIQNAIAESFEGKAIVEEFIEGEEYSVETISVKGKHSILAITEKITSGAPNFVELEHHQPAILNKEIINEIYSVVQIGLDALEIKFGASHTELKVNQKGVFLIEVGARMGGDFIGSHLVQLSTGYDFLKNTLNVALGKDIDLYVKSEEKAAGIYFLSKINSYLLPYFSEEYDGKIKFVEKNMRTNDLEEVFDSSNRCGYLIYQRDTKLVLHER